MKIDIDEVVENPNAAFEILNDEINTLYNYFSDKNRDNSKFDEMLKLYDENFVIMWENWLRFLFGKRDYQDIVDKFTSTGEMIARELCVKQDGKEIGNSMVQSILDKKQIIGKHPSLLQYVFLMYY